MVSRLLLLLAVLLFAAPALANSLILDGTAKSLELETGSAASTDYVVSYVDNTSTTFSPALSHGNITTATTTTILAAPAASTQRQVKWISIRNASPGSSQTATLKLDVSASEFDMTPAVVLAAGESALIDASGEIRVYDATGLLKQATIPESTNLLDPYGMVGTQATQQTLGALRDLPEFMGLAPEIPWHYIYVDPYYGSDSNPGTEQEPIQTLDEAKARTNYAARVRLISGRIFSPLMFDYSTNLTGQCIVGETVTYNTTLQARILAIDPEADIIVFQTVRPADPATSVDDLDNADTPTGDVSGCTWSSLAGKTSTIGDAYNAPVNIDNMPASLQDRIVALWESWPNPEIEAKVNCDGINVTNPFDDATLWFSNTTDTDSGYFGGQNIRMDECAGDAIANNFRGKVRLLNVTVWNNRQADGTTGDSTQDIINANCATTHINGKLDVVNLRCLNHAPTSGTAGSAIAPTASGGASEMVLIGFDPIYEDDSIAGAANSVMAGTGGHNVVIGHDFLTMDTTPSQSMSGATLRNSDGPATYEFAKMVFKSNNQGSNSLGGIRWFAANSTDLLKIRCYQCTFTGGPIAINPAEQGSSLNWDAELRGIIADEFGSSGERVIDHQPAGGDCADSRLVITGVYDDNNDGTSTNDWDIAGTSGVDDRATAQSTADAAGCGDNQASAWSLFETASVDANNTDSFDGDARYACDQATPAGCYQLFDETWTITLPHCLYDYLPTPICSVSGGGVDQNAGAR